MLKRSRTNVVRDHHIDPRRIYVHGLYLAAWRFMNDRPFGIAESPYAQGLAAGFPAYCAAQG